MAWIAVDKNGREFIYMDKPNREFVLYYGEIVSIKKIN